MNSSSMIDLQDAIWRLLFLATPFMLILAGLTMLINLARKPNYRNIEKSFKKSQCLKRAVQIWGNKSLRSRTSVVATLTGVALLPSFFIKRNLLDTKEASAFPAHLKNRMRTSSWLLLTGSFWLILTDIYY
ncbi:hypothetical protein ACQ7NP_05190 [Pseudomonas anuradhapurensis]